MSKASPSISLAPSSGPPTTPTLVPGSNADHLTSVVVQSVSPLSFSSRGNQTLPVVDHVTASHVPPVFSPDSPSGLGPLTTPDVTTCRVANSMVDAGSSVTSLLPSRFGLSYLGSERGLHGRSAIWQTSQHCHAGKPHPAGSPPCSVLDTIAGFSPWPPILKKAPTPTRCVAPVVRLATLWLGTLLPPSPGRLQLHHHFSFINPDHTEIGARTPLSSIQAATPALTLDSSSSLSLVLVDGTRKALELILTPTLLLPPTAPPFVAQPLDSPVDIRAWAFHAFLSLASLEKEVVGES